MKTFFRSVLTLLVSVTVVAKAGSGFLSNQEFMPVDKAEKKYGRQTFDPKKFKEGTQKARASMAVDLIKVKRYVGKPISLVRSELGSWDGYFESDGIPAFLIESSDVGSKETWQLLFLPDKSGRNVAEVKIHKNCCD